MLGKQPDATDNDVPRPKPKADTTTRSAIERRPPTVASLGRRATALATMPKVAVKNRMSDNDWNDAMDAKFLAREGAGMTRLQNKRTPIITPPNVEYRASLKPKPLDEETDIPREPPDEHVDFQRWREEEQKHLDLALKKRDEEERKRNDEKLQLVLKRIAEVEQQQERCNDNIKAYVETVAKVDQHVAKKADKEQVDQQARDLASLRPRIDEVKKDALNLQTRVEGLSEKVDLVESSQGVMKTAIDANTKADLEIRGRVHVLENPVPVKQVDTTNLGAIATAIAADEQPQANTGAPDPKVSALTDKTDGHDQRIERLETAMSDVVPKMDKATPWAEWVGDELETHAQYFSEHKDIPEKVKEIEATHERQAKLLDEALTKQKEAFEEQLKQQKEASDKEKQDLKESMQEQMRLSEASIRKEYDERLASKDKEFADLVAKTDAAKKEQDDRQNQLENKMNDLFAMMQGQTAPQQAPAPVQGQPQAPQPQPAPAPQGNGPWAATPTPANTGPQPVSGSDVNMGGIPDLDDEMKDADAASEPPQQQHRFFQPRSQPSQPNFATQDDTPMTSGEPMIPDNNGDLGFGPKPQPMGSTQPFAGTGPAQPPFQAPIPPAAPVATGNGSSPFGSSAGGPMIPTTPAPSKFGYNGPPPAVNKPQINWSASAGSLNFDPPAGMDIDDDDDKPLAPKPRQPLMNAAPATPWAVQPAANNAPSGNAGGSDTVMTNGPSAPVKPQAPAPTKPSAPKPVKKKADPMVQRKPGATPSKPKETTSKAQTAQTKIASLAQQKQAAFAAHHGSTLTPKTIVEQTASPSQNPSAFTIPGLTGAVNTSPFAMKPKAPAPAPVPEPAPPAGFTTVIGGPGNPAPQYTPTSGVSYKPASPASGPKPPFSSYRSPTYSPTSPMYNPTSSMYSPMSPASNTAPSAPRPQTSPLANAAATSDTIESATTTNVFSKPAEKPVEPSEAKAEAGGATSGVAEPGKPADNADDIPMSGAEGKPEATKAHKYETAVNSRKHAAETQIVPSDDAKIHRRESQEDAKSSKPEGGAKAPEGQSRDASKDDKQGSQGGDVMETKHPDRPMAKPKGKTSKLTADQIKRQKDDFNQQAAWDSMQKAFYHETVQAMKEAESAGDDVVDWGDPNDMNDEDNHITTMVPPNPNVMPTKYSHNWFKTWRAHFMSQKHLELQAFRFGCDSERDVAHFINRVREEDKGHNVDSLIKDAKIPIKQAYSKSEMVMLIGAFRDVVFLQALFDLDLDDVDPGFKSTCRKFLVEMSQWFPFHKPDAV